MDYLLDAPSHIYKCIAWTGTDSPNHLNVASTSDGTNFTVLTLHNQSVDYAGPGLAELGGKLYLSWTGGSSLVNYISSSDGVNWGDQVVTSWKAEGATHMATSADENTLYITFADVTANNPVQVYGTQDGVNWPIHTTRTFGGKGSPFAPAVIASPGLLVGFASYPTPNDTPPAGNCPWNCIVVNGQLVPNFIQPGTGAPGTTGTGGPGLAELNGANYIAWNGGLSNAQGADPHIFIAAWGTQPMSYFVTPQSCRGNPAIVGWNGHLWMVWTGANSGRNINIQWVK